MITFDLSDKNSTNFVIQSFPDGQQQVWIRDGKSLYEKEVDVRCRLTNFMDLEILICCCKSLRLLGVSNINVAILYFLGARSDRKFEDGSNNYLRDVICPIINSLNFSSVLVLDPHSDVLEGCLNNFNKLDNEYLVKYVLFDLYESHKSYSNMILLSPDSGANKKIHSLAKKIGHSGDIITCSKSRDNDGRLTNLDVPFSINKYPENPDIIIIDDICDGGATFINIAKWFKERAFQNKLYLVVTHGIFSKGLKELAEYFDVIYCTNSYRDIDSMNDFGMHNEKYLHKIKQYKLN